MLSLNVFILGIFAFDVGVALLNYQYDREYKIWYKFYSNEANWREANETCYQEGTILASPLDKSLVKIYRTIATEEIHAFYVGVRPQEWKSIEGIPLSDFEENLFAVDIEKSTPCAVLDYGRLKSVSCVERYSFLCYKRDINAIRSVGCETGETGYEWNENTGHCYKFHGEPRTWLRAFGVCLAEKAYLAIINSKKEAEFIQHKFQQNMIESRQNYGFVGVIDWDRNGSWSTVDGARIEIPGFTDSDPNEPRHDIDQIYGTIDINTGHLLAGSSTQEYYFICEKDIILVV